MLKIVDVATMRKVEKQIDESGTSYDELMTSAGRAIADRILELAAAIQDPRVTVLVGKGNNGGDGLTAATFIAQDAPDIDLRVYLTDERDDERFKAAEEANVFMAAAADDKDKRVLKNMIASADIVIDAIFGIGIELPIRDEAAKIMRTINQTIHKQRNQQSNFSVIDPAAAPQTSNFPQPYVIAVDCPSGTDCDTGEVDQNVIPADETLTFIAAKTGLLQFPAAEHAGRIFVAPLVKRDHKALSDFEQVFVDAELVKPLLNKRTEEANKGTFGKVLVVGGSVNYTGAPALSALAAYSAGAGLVTIGTPRPVGAVLAAALLDTTWIMLPHDLGVLAEGAVDILAEELDKFSAMLLGPGITTEKATKEFVNAFLSRGTKNATPLKRAIGFVTGGDANDNNSTDHEITIPPLVVDADALNILSELENWWECLPEDSIITPHPGEMARLSDQTTEDVQKNRSKIASEKAAEWECTIVLKGAHTIIAQPDGNLFTLPFKNQALAVAGTGDVLAGIIAGLRAQGLNARDAAIAGAYVHGLAGEIGRSAEGARSLTASKLVDYVGFAFDALE